MSRSKIVFVVLLVIFFSLLGYVLFLEPKNTPSQEPSENDTLESVQNDVSELKIEDIEVGTGDEVVESGDEIVIHYKGTLLDGTVFDSSYDRGEPFQTQIGVGQVIKGWDEGVIGMKVGGKRKLTIPSDMAYGDRGVGAIPPNSPLIFEVELIEILK